MRFVIELKELARVYAWCTEKGYLQEGGYDPYRKIKNLDIHREPIKDYVTVWFEVDNYE